MGNVYAMNKKKKEFVNERQQRVLEACERLEKKGEKVTYGSVSVETRIPDIDDKGIPEKTLEKSYYSDIINRYRVNGKGVKSVINAERYEEEIRHLKQIISSLRQQNKELKTELFSKKKI